MNAGRQPLALGDPGRGVSASVRRSRAVRGPGAPGVTRDSTRRLAAPDEALLESAWLAGTDAPADVFEQVLELAIEIAREGREAAASITNATNAVAVVVSESSVVRVMSDGELVAEVLPELWLLRRFVSHMEHPQLVEHRADNVIVVSESPGPLAPPD